MKTPQNTFEHDLPNKNGFFGEYGGSFIPPELQTVIDEITAAYIEIRQDPEFRTKLAELYQHYVGRPSPLFHAKGLSKKYGADIYLNLKT